MKTYIYLFLITLSFNSCVTLPSKKMLDNLEMNDDEGIVVGSISMDKRTYSHGVHLYYSKIDEIGKIKTYSIQITRIIGTITIIIALIVFIILIAKRKKNEKS